VELGPVDLKFNPWANRVAASSVDGSLRVFNIVDGGDKEGSTPLLATSPGEEATAWKMDFSPDGSEILTGSLSLRTLDVNLKPTKPDFNAPSKFIHSMTYGPEKHNIAACGNIDGVV